MAIQPIRFFSLTVDFAKTIPFGSELNFQGCDFKTQWEKTYPIIANLENSDFKTSGILLSDQQNKFIQEFKQVIKNSKLADSVLVFEEISELERRIWNSSMTTGEKYQLLLGTAVGKYSWKFWSQDDFSFSNIRTGSKDIDPEFPFDWDEFLVTLMEADMDGAIVGAIVGCIAGAIGGTAVMPGVGTITACVLESVYGAALGGIAASSYAAVKYLIKHFFGDDEAHH